MGKETENMIGELFTVKVARKVLGEASKKCFCSSHLGVGVEPRAQPQLVPRPLSPPQGHGVWIDVLDTVTG